MKMRFSISLFCALMSLILLAACNKDDPNAGFNAELNDIDTYLMAFKSKYTIRDIYGYDNRIVITKFGYNGAQVRKGQTVKVTYRLSLFKDSTNVIDQGVLTDVIDNVKIAGLQIGIASLFQGTEATLFVPSRNAFGSTATATIPANSTVRYDIRLDSVYRTADQLTQFNTDIDIIENYLDTANVKNAIYHPGGFYYTIDAQGSSTEHPKLYSTVNFNYQVKLLTNGSVIDQGSINNPVYYQLIDGVKLGLTTVQEGGKATFYLPSGLAYGPDGQAPVGKNACLIFSASLNSIN